MDTGNGAGVFVIYGDQTTGNVKGGKNVWKN